MTASNAHTSTPDSLPTRLAHFARLLLRRLVEDNAPQHAAALTYTTLLSLVPLLAVSLAVFSAFPVADKVSQTLQDFVFSNFVPASGETLQRYLDEFSAKASRMTGPGFAFLVLVALLLIANIDRAINAIWRVKRKRSALNQFLVYWSVLSLGPVLIALSIAVTSYVISLPLLTEAAATIGLAGKLLGLTPVLVSALAFTLIYAIIPNRPVPLRHAFAGGLVAAVLFELAKRGFGYYVTHFPTYEAIYGALAAVPIFLIWVYLSWLVTLLGAEFTYCLGIFRRQPRLLPWHGDNLLDALRLLKTLWRAQQRGQALRLHQLADELPGYSEERLEMLLLKLAKSQMVLETSSRRWALARDLTHVSLLELYRLQPFVLPDDQQLEQQADAAEQAQLQAINACLSQQMDVPLESLFDGHGPD